MATLKSVFLSCTLWRHLRISVSAHFRRYRWLTYGSSNFMTREISSSSPLRREPCRRRKIYWTVHSVILTHSFAPGELSRKYSPVTLTTWHYILVVVCSSDNIWRWFKVTQLLQAIGEVFVAFLACCQIHNWRIVFVFKRMMHRFQWSERLTSTAPVLVPVFTKVLTRPTGSDMCEMGSSPVFYGLRVSRGMTPFSIVCSLVYNGALIRGYPAGAAGSWIFRCVLS